ncbi:MAG: Gfo/Idh/MocA family oxidoreductase [Anaerolineaceae bacterium]|jgi:predicted dehydrogenase|nr:Gfo/Idh/MocA family oxidoreductase [Anaerolineaceae bacterium]MDD4043285.1 Gfo/Idh/MocA family oxidoreductase [Anaerolineaceae bacterium]MDD4577183.1 Gfo/Idh/MocA family oxidoreductase [Anaerolineaceae bacterium]
MKFLIAGLGSIGRRHLRNLKLLGQTDLILYRTHQATLPDTDLVDYPAYTNLQEALEQKPDGVIVSNPTALHLEVATASAKAGAALLIEKPVSDSLIGIRELQEALDQAGKPALVGFHLRYHPVLIQIKALIDNDVLGKPLKAHAHWGEFLPGWHPWEDYRHSYAARADLGGGALNTLSHPIDYLRWMMGEVRSLSARLDNLSPLELDVEDNAELILKFHSGSLGTIHLDYYQRPPSHTLDIAFEKGRVRWDSRSGCATIENAEQETIETICPPDGFDRNDMFLAEMKDFIRLTQEEDFPHCTLADGKRVQKIVEVARQSSSQSGCSVHLPS